MIQLTPQMRILVAVERVDFRKGIDTKIIEQRTDCTSTVEGVVKDFRDLQVWQKAHQLALTVYRLGELPP